MAVSFHGGSNAKILEIHAKLKYTHSSLCLTLTHSGHDETGRYPFDDFAKGLRLKYLRLSARFGIDGAEEVTVRQTELFLRGYLSGLKSCVGCG